MDSHGVARLFDFERVSKTKYFLVSRGAARLFDFDGVSKTKYFLVWIVYQKLFYIFSFLVSRGAARLFDFDGVSKTKYFLVFCFGHSIKNIFLVFYFFISVIWIAKKLFKVLFFGLKNYFIFLNLFFKCFLIVNKI